MTASILLGLQPIASILTFSSSPIIPILIYLILVVIYKAVDVIYNYRHLTDIYHIHEASNGHLAWNWLQPTLFTTIGLIIYFAFLFGPILVTQYWDILGIALCTLLISLYSYYKYNTWGSMWCWVVNVIVVLSCVRIFFTQGVI